MISLKRTPNTLVNNGVVGHCDSTAFKVMPIRIRLRLCGISLNRDGLVVLFESIDRSGPVALWSASTTGVTHVACISNRPALGDIQKDIDILLIRCPDEAILRLCENNHGTLR